MTLERSVAHFAARRIAGTALRRVGLLRLLPGGLVAFVLAEGFLFGLKQLRARPDLRRTLWRIVSERRKLSLGRARNPF
jgi:hypothetical protein